MALGELNDRHERSQSIWAEHSTGSTLLLGGVLGIIGRRNIAFGLLFLYRFGRNFHMGWMVLTRACYYSALNVKRSFLNAQSGFYAWQFHSGFSYRPIACHVYVGSDLSTSLA